DPQSLSPNRAPPRSLPRRRRCWDMAVVASGLSAVAAGVRMVMVHMPGVFDLGDLSFSFGAPFTFRRTSSDAYQTSITLTRISKVALVYSPFRVQTGLGGGMGQALQLQ